MRSNYLLLTAGLMAVIALPAAAKPEQGQKAGFQKIYDSISKALSGKEIETVMNTRAEGYTSLDSDGTTHLDGKDAERQRLERVFAIAAAIRDKTTVQSVQAVGKDQVVTIKEDYTRTQEDPRRGEAILHEVGTYRDFWINDGGTWRLKRSRVLHQTTTKTVNGQPVP